MNKAKNVKLLLEKAEESLEVAEKIYKGGYYGFCASRVYYAMYYAAEAVLLHKDLQFSKHSAVLSSFNKEFIKTGIFPRALFKALQKSFDLRLEGDYGLIPVDKKEAEAIIKEADTFIKQVSEFLKKESY